MQGDHYCEHFRNLKFTKTIDIGQEPACKYCLIGKNYLWLCLAKNCGCLFCDRNNKQHIRMHLEQSKTKKSFHSIFINVLTAQIVCVHCDIEIYDLDAVRNVKKEEGMPDPFDFRLKILPALSLLESQKNKIMGQLENSQGHKKISRALTGFFGDKRSTVVNSALQFLMQFELFRDIALCVRPFNKEIEQVARIFHEAEQASFRAISTNELIKILLPEMPSLLSYKRKDPFQFILHFMTKIHEHIKYYTMDYEDTEYDEWDLLGNPASASRLTLNCPLFDNMSITLSLNYVCKKCDREQSLPATVNFLKLSIPKKKRKVKQVEKELAQHRFSSPVKNRRKSLANLFKKQQQCPLTIPQLIISFTKQPLHKDKICSICKNPLQKNKIHFETLPEYLIIQINRMGADGNSIDMTNIEFTTDLLDLGSFTANKTDSVVYQFQTALCVQNYCTFPVVGMSRFNKQTYIFKNELVTMLKLEKTQPNPYILCYKKQCPTRDHAKLRDSYHNIKSNIEILQQSPQSQAQSPGRLLPDFWVCQLKNQIPRHLHLQQMCKHRKLRPQVQTKMRQEERVPGEVYEYLLEMFKGDKFREEECPLCVHEIEKIRDRKKIEKEKIIEYEKIKSSCYCMVSNIWIKRWMNFLYAKGTIGYFSKGHPMPGPIDNKSLLDGQKCRTNLQKNQDYKVVNIFIWRFLKQLYGGGPQIRYKWNKNQINQTQEQKIREIKITAREIKQIYAVHYIESPKKTSMIIQKTTSFVESVRGSEEAEQLSLPQQIS